MLAHANAAPLGARPIAPLTGTAPSGGWRLPSAIATRRFGVRWIWRAHSWEETDVDQAGKKASAEGAKSNALQKPLQPSAELAAVVGTGPLSRGEVVSKVWDYIKSHNLQNPENRREILADDKLRKVFGRDKVTMFEMNRHLAQHLK